MGAKKTDGGRGPARQASRGQLRKAVTHVESISEAISEVTRPAQSRKRLLVSSGPSRTGKTEFVRIFFPLGCLLELNCSAPKSVCFAGFDAAVHRDIFWDDASPILVTKN